MATSTTCDSVTALELSRQIEIPLRAIYRLVERKRIPFEDVTQPWYEPGVKRMRFNVQAVRDALGLDRERQAS